MKTVLYPGSFDPVTNGHFDVIKRAASLFDRLVVAAAVNGEKTPMFTFDERVQLLKEVCKDLPNVEIVSFQGLLVNALAKFDACAVIRGLRAVSDFEYEFQMALTNKKLYPETETIFLTTSAENMYLSSSVVKQIAFFGGDITDFIPEVVLSDVEKKLCKKGDLPNE